MGGAVIEATRDFSTATDTILDRLSGAKVLFVASTGGHLAQLVRLSESVAVHPDSTWITFDKPQSRSLLAGKKHTFIPYIAPRDFLGVVKGVRTVSQTLKRGDFDFVVSTGAGIALTSHWQSLLLGIPTIYIESVSRYEGPSLTGRIMSRLPGVALRTQHKGWADDRWLYEFSVMDSYAVDDDWVPSSPPQKIFVTLGTIHPFRFDSLVDAVVAALPADADVVWQLGSTDRDDLPGEVLREMSSERFDEVAASSDVVITHSGVGTIMKLLDLGVPTLVVPRSNSRNEHVDDHQHQVAHDLNKRGLCVVSSPDDLTYETIVSATKLRVA
jgi:UDP-N-acetylglucosamine--N-acetylmuramyl-(pentapeptide) pyrophosphoryl-undecaprenol N-acetylglucosamine transferase